MEATKWSCLKNVGSGGLASRDHYSIVQKPGTTGQAAR